MVDPNILKTLQATMVASLDSETLKTVYMPKTVRLYHSSWSNSMLYPGKIQIPESSCDTLMWSYPKEPLKNLISLSLLKSGRIMTGTEAKCFIESSTDNSNNLDEDSCLVLAYKDIFCIVFEDAENCQKWIRTLKVLLRALNLQVSCDEWKSELNSTYNEYSYTADQYGAIFDISEADEENDSWQTIKVTFIKEDNTQVEYLTFEKAQKNLFNSAQEVLASIESYLDAINVEILKSYLNDLIRTETISRTEKIEDLTRIKDMVPASLKFRRKENTQIRSSYGELKATEIGARLIKMMKDYEKKDYGDGIADCFNMIYMQKLAFSLDLHQLACEHQIMAMRKSLELAANTEEIKVKPRKSDSPSNTERRINNIINKKEPQKEDKSIFRDACDCLII